MEEKKTFSEIVTPYLQKLDRPAAWLATQLEVSPSTVSRWLNDEIRPGSSDLVLKLAELLEMPLDDRRKLLESAGYKNLTIATRTIPVSQLRVLGALMSGLYPDIADIVRILSGLNVDVQTINSGSSPEEWWKIALDETNKQGKIGRLINQVSKEYESNNTIKDVLELYEKTVLSRSTTPVLNTNQAAVEYFRKQAADIESNLKSAKSNETKRQSSNNLGLIVINKDAEERVTRQVPPLTLTFSKQLDSFSAEEQKRIAQLVIEVLKLNGEVKVDLKQEP